MFSCLMFYQQGEIQPKNDDLITTIPQWGPEYEISLEVFVDANSWGPSSSVLLFRAKPDKDCCDVGYRVPCIYVHPENSHKILIATQIQNSNWIGAEGNGHTYLDIGDESRWITLHLSQTSTDVSSLIRYHNLLLNFVSIKDGHFFEVKLDGQRMFYEINDDPQQFEDVKVWTNDQHYPNAASVRIRNLQIESGTFSYPGGK